MTVPYQFLLDDVRIKIVIPYLDLKDCISYISSYKNKIPQDIIKNKLIKLINSYNIIQRAIFYKKNFKKMSIVFHYLDDGTIPFDQHLKIVNDSQTPICAINLDNQKTLNLYIFDKSGNYINTWRGLDLKDIINKDITSKNIKDYHVNIHNYHSIHQIRIYNNAHFVSPLLNHHKFSNIEMNASQSFLSKFNLPKVSLRFSNPCPSLSSENILVSFKIN